MIVTINNALLTASFYLKGAELCSLKNMEQQEYIWQADASVWGKHAPVLFPIIGTLKGNNYQYNEQNYSLGRHGFARDMDFEIFEKTESTVEFVLKSNVKTQAVYPFEFAFYVKYVLKDAVLETHYRVENLGDELLPFSVGAHPAFALSLPLTDYSLQFVGQKTLETYVLDQGLLTNKTIDLPLKDEKLALENSLFDIDTLIFKDIYSKKVVLYKGDQKVLQVCFQDFPDLGIWTMKDASFLCIEPWFGHADFDSHTGDIFQKVGILVLASKEVFQAKFSIEIL